MCALHNSKSAQCHSHRIRSLVDRPHTFQLLTMSHTHYTKRHTHTQIDSQSLPRSLLVFQEAALLHLVQPLPLLLEGLRPWCIAYVCCASDAKEDEMRQCHGWWLDRTSALMAIVTLLTWCRVGSDEGGNGMRMATHYVRAEAYRGAGRAAQRRPTPASKSPREAAPSL